MKKEPGIKLNWLWTLLAIACLASCRPFRYAPTQIAYEHLAMSPAADATSASSSKLQALMRPYTDSVSSTMRRPIGTLAADLTKNWPECSLGNLMCDAYLSEARRIYNRKVDFSLMNYGGIRLNHLPAGTLTNGMIYELMPFDNLLVLLELSGRQVQALLDHVASRGGWPVAGVSYAVRNGKAADIRLGGNPLQPDATYVLATSDFVANGGDDSFVLKGIPQLSNGTLQRDVIIHYIETFTKAGRQVPMPEGGRVLRAE